ncbi:hypothetical protein T492DRAFT_856540 [Pavlovales sp. CCMP2436]|nr:hypothetical protein T492DRAFT_856540 [Pavlovales sp. CCMP2436]
MVLREPTARGEPGVDPGAAVEAAGAFAGAAEAKKRKAKKRGADKSKLLSFGDDEEGGGGGGDDDNSAPPAAQPKPKARSLAIEAGSAPSHGRFGKPRAGMVSSGWPAPVGAANTQVAQAGEYTAERLAALRQSALPPPRGTYDDEGAESLVPDELMADAVDEGAHANGAARLPSESEVRRARLVREAARLGDDGGEGHAGGVGDEGYVPFNRKGGARAPGSRFVTFGERGGRGGPADDSDAESEPEDTDGRPAGRRVTFAANGPDSDNAPPQLPTRLDARAAGAKPAVSLPLAEDPPLPVTEALSRLGAIVERETGRVERASEARVRAEDDARNSAATAARLEAELRFAAGRHVYAQHFQSWAEDLLDCLSHKAESVDSAAAAVLAARASVGREARRRRRADDDDELAAAAALLGATWAPQPARLRAALRSASARAEAEAAPDEDVDEFGRSSVMANRSAGGRELRQAARAAREMRGSERRVRAAQEAGAGGSADGAGGGVAWWARGLGWSSDSDAEVGSGSESDGEEPGGGGEPGGESPPPRAGLGARPGLGARADDAALAALADKKAVSPGHAERAQLRAALGGALSVWADVSDEFVEPAVVLGTLLGFQAKLPDDWERLYAAECAPAILEPLLRTRVVRWRAWADSPGGWAASLVAQQADAAAGGGGGGWVRVDASRLPDSLAHAAVALRVPDGAARAAAATAADAAAALAISLVAPVLAHAAEHTWDPHSARQGERLRAAAAVAAAAAGLLGGRERSAGLAATAAGGGGGPRGGLSGLAFSRGAREPAAAARSEERAAEALAGVREAVLARLEQAAAEVATPPCAPPLPGVSGASAEHAAVWAGAQRRFFRALKLAHCAAAWRAAPVALAPSRDALLTVCATAVHEGAMPLLQAAARSQPPRWWPFARLATALIDTLFEADLVDNDEDGGMANLTLVAPTRALLLKALSTMEGARAAGAAQSRVEATAETKINELLARLSA